MAQRAMENNNKTNDVLKVLDDINFVFESGKMNMGGHRLINNKLFEEVMETAKIELLDQLERSMKIEQEEAHIIEQAEKRGHEMVQEMEEYLNGMDIVAKSREIAQNLMEDAQEEARRIMAEAEEASAKLIHEAEETKERSIEYGEQTKTKLINQGYKFLEEQISTAMQAMEDSKKQTTAIQNRLQDAYEDLSSTLEADNQFDSHQEKKNA